MIAPFVTALVLGVGSVDTRAIPPTAPTHANVLCSLAYGCEVDLPAGEKLRDVRMVGQDLVAQVVAPGDTDPGSGAVIEVLPTTEFTTAPSGAMQPVTGRLIVLTTAREYNIIVDASETLAVNRVAFTGVGHRAVVLAMPPPHAADPTPPPGEAAPLDPTTMDFGWRMEGDASLRCDTVFSVATRGQLWCKMPRTLYDVPSAYFDDGKLKVPLTSRVVAQHYLVIDTLRSPIVLEIGGGHPQTLRIIRDRE